MFANTLRAWPALEGRVDLAPKRFHAPMNREPFARRNAALTSAVRPSRFQRFRKLPVYETWNFSSFRISAKIARVFSSSTDA